uniref:Uncharacterized protein n=1 Tax=Parascaris univalens TaxID=6257 RepID=A0A914ZK78_PARUN
MGFEQEWKSERRLGAVLMIAGGLGRKQDLQTYRQQSGKRTQQEIKVAARNSSDVGWVYCDDAGG